MQLSGKRLKAAVSDFGHLAGLPFLLILAWTIQLGNKQIDSRLGALGLLVAFTYRMARSAKKQNSFYKPVQEKPTKMLSSLNCILRSLKKIPFYKRRPCNA